MSAAEPRQVIEHRAKPTIAPLGLYLDDGPTVAVGLPKRQLSFGLVDHQNRQPTGEAGARIHRDAVFRDDGPALSHDGMPVYHDSIQPAAVIEKRLPNPEQVLLRLLADGCVRADASMCEKDWVLVDDEDGLPEHIQVIRMMLEDELPRGIQVEVTVGVKGLPATVVKPGTQLALVALEELEKPSVVVASQENRPRMVG